MSENQSVTEDLNIITGYFQKLEQQGKAMTEEDKAGVYALGTC